jgi:hypothetical protein
VTASAQRLLVGTLRVALPPDRAFRLFTARGEADWVPGWKPRFPAPADDDTAPGTVFETTADGQTTTWVVVDRAWGRHIRYARVMRDVYAGTVTVTLDGAGEHSEVTVAYHLTALSEAGRDRLDEFAAGYPAFLRSWEAAIAEALPRLA